MYTPAMYRNAQLFQSFMDAALLEGWGDKTLQWYFDNENVKYQDQAAFLSYFIYPYLSIINGYGAALRSSPRRGVRRSPWGLRRRRPAAPAGN